MKKLYLFITLLSVILCIAIFFRVKSYSAGPSAQLSVTIVPPSDSTPPPPAVVAGFTTLVESFDFTSSFYATKSNYLDCAGGSQWNLTWQGELASPPINYSSLCSNTVNQVVDSVTGQNVLLVSYSNADMIGGGFQGTNCPVFTVAGQYCNGLVQPINTTLFPQFLWEGRVRFEMTNYGHMSPGWAGGGTNGSGIELDYLEVFGFAWGPCQEPDPNNVTADQSHIWCSGHPPNYPTSPAFKYSDWHTYWYRYTQNATQAIYCGWIDGILIGCTDQTSIWVSHSLNIADGARLGIVMLAGANSVEDTPHGTTKMYLAHMKVWSCADWISGSPKACFTSNANPGGYPYGPAQ